MFGSGAPPPKTWDAFLSHAAASAQVLLLILSASASFRPIIDIPEAFLPALLVTLVWSCFGFGALLAKTTGLWARRGPKLTMAAAFSILAAVLLLAGHPGTAVAAIFGMISASAAGFSMALYGAVAATALRGAVWQGRTANSRVVAAAGAGAVIGFSAAFFAARWFGVNVSLLILAGIVISSTWRPFIGPLIAILAGISIAPQLPRIEWRLEDLRAAPLEGMTLSIGREFPRKILKRTMLYWGGSGKFEEYTGGGMVFLAYNNLRVMQHASTEASDNHAHFLFSFTGALDVLEGEKVLSIGAADGVRLRNMVGDKKIGLTIVEINDAAVRAYTDNPDRNHGIFLRSRVFARDGRSILEATPPQSYDLVVYEFADSGIMTFGSASQNFSLGTREGIAALDRALSPRGRVVFLSADKRQALMFAGGVKGLGWNVRAYNFPTTPRYTVSSVLNRRWYAVIALRPGARHPFPDADWNKTTPVSPEEFTEPMPDNFPTRNGIMKQCQLLCFFKPSTEWIQCSMLITVLLLGLLLAASIVPSSPFARHIRPEELFFLRIGAGWIIAQLMVLQALKPLLGETLSTTVAVNVGLGTASAVGSLAACRLRDARRSAVGLAAAMAAALPLSMITIKMLRLKGIDMTIPWLGLLGATAPLGITVGLFFPLGLALIRPENIGRILVADAVGAVGGFALYRVFLIQFGTAASPWLCAAVYLSVCWGLRRASIPAEIDRDEFFPKIK